MKRDNIVGVSAIILKQDLDTGEISVLVGRRISKAGNGLLAIPGGTLESGELVFDGIKREVLEETNLKIIEANPIGFSEEFSDVHDIPRYITLYLDCIVENFDDLKNMEADKCEGWFWMPIIELEDDKVELWQDSKQQIFNVLYGKGGIILP